MLLDVADDDVRIGTARVINQAAQTVLTMKARTDESQFRRQTFNKLPELLRLIGEEDRRRKLIESSTQL